MTMNDDGPRFSDHRWVAHTLVARDGRYLLLKRGAGRYLGGQWDIPGGSVEPGETAREAARRETTEEAALDVRITDEITHFTNADTGGRPICFHTVTFLGIEPAPLVPVVLSPAEHDEYRWLLPTEALRLDLVWHVRRTFKAVAAADDLR